MLVLQVVNPAHLEMAELEAVGVGQWELSPLKSGPLLQNRLTGEKKDISLYSGANVLDHHFYY